MGLLNSAGPADIDLAKGALHDESPVKPERCTPPLNDASNQLEQDGAVEAETPPSAAKPGQSGRPAAVESTDAAILAKAQAGDHAAFAHLYALHKRRVYSLCLRMLGNVAE